MNARQQQRWRMSERALKDAEKALAGNDPSPNNAANRAYYAMQHAVQTVILGEETSPRKSHEGVRLFLSDNLVRTGKLDSKFNKLYVQVTKTRMRADYAEDVSWNDARTAVDQATQLVEAIKNILFLEHSNENSLDDDDDLEDQSMPAP